MAENLPVQVEDNVPAETESHDVVTAEPEHLPAARPEFDTNSPAVFVDFAFNEMASWNEQAAKSLRRRWGSDAAKNLQFADAFAETHSDVVSAIESASPGLSDHPAIIEAAAILGRRYAKLPGNPATIKKQTAEQERIGNMELQDALDEIRAKGAEAKAKGQHTRANEIYVEEQRIIAQHKGNGPIVNGRRTS